MNFYFFFAGIEIFSANEMISRDYSESQKSQTMEIRKIK